MTEDAVRARAGDLIEVEEHRVGSGGRTGTILKVLGTRERPHYRVRWEDGRETIFYPGNDAHVVRKKRPAAAHRA